MMSPPTPSKRSNGTAAPRPLRIGPVVVDPPLLSAPMAGYTNFAFRQMIRGLGGVGLVATEMVNAKGFVQMQSRRGEYPERLWGVRDEVRPLAVQIWDNDPETLARTGVRLVEDLGVSVVDVNFGCPVRKVTEGARSGSYLLRDPSRVAAIVDRLVRACGDVPVTAKIRLGPNRRQINAPLVARAIEEAGAAALTVHGRTTADMFKGSADWDRIAEVKDHLRRIPLIGNGDLASPEAVARALERYPVDGVMIGRAALGRPWLFRQAAAALRGGPIPAEPTLTEQRELLLHHFDLVVERFGPKKGTLLMRKYAAQYGQGRHGARAFRARVVSVKTPEEFRSAVWESFPA